jgi:hypothetical protein
MRLEYVQERVNKGSIISSTVDLLGVEFLFHPD